MVEVISVVAIIAVFKLLNFICQCRADKQYVKDIEEIRKNTGIDKMTPEQLKELSDTVDSCAEHCKNTLTCPKCGSTAITTGERGFKVTTGFIGAGKTVNRCGNCGHTWTPKG